MKVPEKKSNGEYNILRKNKKREFPNIKWEIPFVVKNKYCNFAAKSTIKK